MNPYADIYRNFAHLAAKETAGRAFRIRMKNRGTPVVVLGPHAGGIEPGTSELVTAVAGKELSYYLFEGKKTSGNQMLHITSTHFDEPAALAIVSSSQTAIAFHGEKSETEMVYLGGRDQTLRPHIEKCLQNDGFAVATHKDPFLQGTAADNICNRCASGAGLQVELSHGLRRRLFRFLNTSGRRQPTEAFDRFVRSVRGGIQRANAL